VTFLRESSYSDRPWLAEMAEFEWLLMEAFDATDTSIISIEEMSNIPHEKWPELRFKMHPSLRRLNLQWNIVAIWNAITNQTACPSPLEAEEQLSWMIWRKELSTMSCSLSMDEAYVIDAMNSEENFSSICEGLCEWIDPENVAMHAALLLKRFILDNLVIQIDY
jgi:hypothetical protein